MPITQREINRLKGWINKKSTNRAQQERVVAFYEDRKIPSYLTAENLLLQLTSSNKLAVAKGLKQLSKYEDAQSVTGRLTRESEQKKYLRTTGKTTDEKARVKRLNKEEELANQPIKRIKSKRPETEAEKQTKPKDIGKVKVRITKKMKEESANKIRNRYLKYSKPRVTFKNLDKVTTSVEISVEHLKKEQKFIEAFLNKNREKLVSSARKLLILKTNMKFGLGVNATFESTDKASAVTNTISTKHVTCNTSAEVPRVVDSLIEDCIQKFNAINHKGSGYTVKKINHVFLTSYKVTAKGFQLYSNT